MSFLLGFFLEATLGMIGFWFLEVNSLLFVYMLLSFFFSGHMFPIDMLPGVLGTIGKADPFPIPGLFSRGRVPGQNPRRRAGKGLERAICLGGVFHCRQPPGLPFRHASDTADMEDEEDRAEQLLFGIKRMQCIAQY